MNDMSEESDGSEESEESEESFVGNNDGDQFMYDYQ